jgi:hypothetical protein
MAWEVDVEVVTEVVDDCLGRGKGCGVTLAGSEVVAWEGP